MPAKDWIYTLTDEDMELASRVAKQRDEGKPNSAHKGAMSEKESRENHFKGLKGEIAFGRTFGLQVDRQKRQNGDKGYDFQTAGFTIQVKYRAESGKDFALKGAKLSPFVAHAGVMTWAESNREVRLVGWTTPPALLNRGEWDVWEKVGPKLFIEHKKLFEMEWLRYSISRAQQAYTFHQQHT